MTSGTGSITDRQNEAGSITLLAAQRQAYGVAKRVRAIRVAGNVGLAAAVPVVVLWWVDGGRWLGAAAGLWMLLSRWPLRAIERRAVGTGADIQEQFDAYVLGLPWNGLRGTKVGAMAVEAAARRHLRRRGTEQEARLHDWYPDRGVPLEALDCQQVNVGWSARLHHEWATVLVAVIAVWATVVVALAIARDVSLTEFLVAVFLPSMPALVDAMESVDGNRQSAGACATVEVEIDGARAGLADAGPDAMVARCRSVQDEIWALRRQGVLVPDLYYRWRRPAYEQDSRHAVHRMSAPQP